MFPFHKPLLPSHYSIWFEPPDELGDEVLHIVSERRSLKLKGQSFREFQKRVIPLLDGLHTLPEIQVQTADIFRAEDLEAALNMIGEHGLLAEGDGLGLPDDVTARLAPQLNYFHEMTDGGRNMQAALAAAKIAILGLGGAGAATALGLAAAGIGHIVCIDASEVEPPDMYFSPFLGFGAVGSNRAEVVARQVRSSAPQTATSAVADELESEADLRRAIGDAQFVISCLGPGRMNLAYKLNKVCFEDKIRWLTCSLEGAEIVVGPAIHPGEGPCYMCYRMRVVAAAANPEEAFAFEKYLDRRKTEDIGRRENLVFGAGIAANILGLETMKELTGLAAPTLVGRLLAVSLADLRIEKHTVLRKPWCPVCFEKQQQAS